MFSQYFNVINCPADIWTFILTHVVETYYREFVQQLRLVYPAISCVSCGNAANAIIADRL